MIRATKSPLEIDILLWLTRRVAFTKTGVFVPFHALKQQFANSQNVTDYDFERWFCEPLQSVAKRLGFEWVEFSCDGLEVPALSEDQKKKLFKYDPIMIPYSQN